MWKWKIFAAAGGLAALAFSNAAAQTVCQGTALTGTVRDSTLALIPGATVTLDRRESGRSGPDGRFRFPCVADGRHRLSAAAQGFAEGELSVTAPHATELDLVLQPATVETQVNVEGGGNRPGTSPTAGGVSQTIANGQLQMLADDPDDLLRELQQLAAAGGGGTANTTIAVDGFDGTSKLPPKSSIAYIRVNPDQFSAEYREPPLGGGRVEVYTKPGLSAYHGALFATNGSPWENARDPFSTSKAAVGKQRYGFELTGPLLGKSRDFSLTLEHRSIDNYAVVDAVTLDSDGNAINTVANVATPQRLWLGTARLDWQLGAKNTFALSYSANVNHLENVGVGGTALAETGYGAEQYEHVIRASDVTVSSAHLMNDARLSLRWDGETDDPNSNAPQLQVAGAFTGGGVTRGPQRLHELNVEADDDVVLTTKVHTLKFGTRWMLYGEKQQLPTNFNGSYTFGGGPGPVLDVNGNSVPGQSQTISGLEEYRRALLGLPGGTPTAFTNVAGSPTVNFMLVEDSLFLQDDWNAGHGFHVASGARYYVQDNPLFLGSLVPRAAILWSPDKKGTWTVHLRAGLFSGGYSEGDTAEVQREDGVERVTSTIYNPVYGNPFFGAAPIHSIRRFSPHLVNLTWSAENIGGTRALPQGWNVSADYYIGRIWQYARTMNINSPLNGVPTGPRPGPANLDFLETQNSGQGRLKATVVTVQQHALKRFQFLVSGIWVDIIDDTDDNYFFNPQSAYTNAGEFAHRTNQPVWQFVANGTVTLTKKIELSTNMQAGGEARYNIVTGFDNNGDGDFNDRPQYAAPGTPGAITTPYGLLVATDGVGVFPRNRGVMPWTVHLDANIQRAFSLTRNAKAEHQQILTVNIRSSNVLNHLNGTQVGGVLGSPLFGQAYAADNGRRIEAGLRYSF